MFGARFALFFAVRNFLVHCMLSVESYEEIIA